MSGTDFTQYVGRDFNEVKQELEAQGLKVHSIRHGANATGLRPRPGEDVVIVHHGGDGNTVTSVEKNK